jgi:hypothetical protein
MTELYRGLLLVVTNKFYELILSFRSHVQSFNQDTTDPSNYFDVGVFGFWNLMLEVILTIFSLFCLLTGVALIASLAVIFYPLFAILRYSALLIKGTRNPPPEHDTFSDQNKKEESPVIIKKEKD